MTKDEFWAIATARRVLALWHRNRGCELAIERIQTWTFLDWGNQLGLVVASKRIDEAKKA